MKLLLGLVLILAPLLVNGSVKDLSKIDSMPFARSTEPLINLFRQSDPTAFQCAVFIEKQINNFYDIRERALRNVPVYRFELKFEDQEPLGLSIEQSFGAITVAQTFVNKFSSSLGRVPNYLRSSIEHLYIHDGRATFHTGPKNEPESQIILYTDTIESFSHGGKLEAALFHESIHAAWDHHGISTSEEWKEAIRTDDLPLTDYAFNVQAEDLAEHALFVYALLERPSRISAEMTTLITTRIPSRINFINQLMQFSKNNLTSSEGSDCDPSVDK